MPHPSTSLGLIIGAALAAAAALWVPDIRVVDGDTVKHGYWRWRVVGIDAPETRGARCPAERAAGAAATARLSAIVAGGGVVLLPQRGRDRFGRRRAILKLRDGTDVAALAIAEGWARAYDGRSQRGGWCP